MLCDKCYIAVNSSTYSLYYQAGMSGTKLIKLSGYDGEYFYILQILRIVKKIRGCYYLNITFFKVIE